MPKAFIAGAKIPTGGAYMAYHIGRLLHLHFGYELVDMHIYDTKTPIFEYDVPIRTIGAAEAERMVTDADVMVVNPAFSQFLYGLRLPGKKIMYIQDFRTFLLLDCHFDAYVSVSNVVARYVQALYDIETQVVPPFIRTNDLPDALPWEERPEGSALVYVKNPSREHQILHKYLSARLKKIAPQIDVSHVVEGRDMTQDEFLKRIGEVRYFVNLSLAEGFGLVPLEAMAMGTMVTGVDGLAGRDYMQQGENAYVGSIKNLRTLPEIIQTAFEDSILAQKCVAGGLQTARMYDYARFKKAWLPILAQTLGQEPHGL